MLVYYYIPQSYGKIGNKQIQGIGINMPPTHVSYKEYLANRSVLIQAPFTPDYIEKKTGKPDFPYRAYITLNTIKTIPYRSLQKIATYFGVEALLDDYALQHSVRKALRDL